MTYNAECNNYHIAIVIPITMIHTMPAAGSVHLTWFSRMWITGGLTESTVTPRQSHPDAETAGTLKTRRLFWSYVMEVFSGVCRKRTSWNSTKENLLGY